jgi:tetratricopeptide (TPR) repeat protein
VASKKRRKRKAKRWPRSQQRAREDPKPARGVKQEITAENWKDLVKAEITQPKSVAQDFAAYVNEHADQLGPEWAAHFLDFMDNTWEDAERLIEIYEQELSRYPPCYIVEANVADAYRHYFGWMNQAKKKYREATALAPDVAIGHYDLGQIYHLLGLFDRSLQEFELAVRYAGDDENELAARSTFNIGIFKSRSGNNKEAKRYIERAVELMPAYPQAEEALRMLKKHDRRFRW